MGDDFQRKFQILEKKVLISIYLCFHVNTVPKTLEGSRIRAVLFCFEIEKLTNILCIILLRLAIFSWVEVPDLKIISKIVVAKVWLKSHKNLHIKFPDFHKSMSSFLPLEVHIYVYMQRDDFLLTRFDFGQHGAGTVRRL